MARKHDIVVAFAEAARRLRSGHKLPPLADLEHSFVRETYLPVAVLANIPDANVDAFLRELARLVTSFQAMSGVDHGRRKHKAAINEFRAATARLLRAIERLERHELSATVDTLYNVYLRGQWPERYQAGTNSPLDDCKREIKVLGVTAGFLSAEEVPGGGKNTRQKKLVSRIWQMPEEYGGSLTYDKHGDGGAGSGTLAEVLAFLKAGMPSFAWTDLSPSTIERLRPKSLDQKR